MSALAGTGGRGGFQFKTGDEMGYRIGKTNDEDWRQDRKKKNKSVERAGTAAATRTVGLAGPVGGAGRAAEPAGSRCGGQTTATKT